ncbi:lanthionine synthetase C family protein [Actinomadura sp. 9N215]|uniref:lanthionine synthetase C family protein n=1 Tax=Actinomadura sp. 9N215 TaxID=3375150 RepID=UPI00378CAB57
MAGALAAALSDPRTALTASARHSWPQALATGAAGIALLHIERARTGHGDWETAHRWITTACAAPITAAANAGLYMGVPALAFILHAATSPARDKAPQQGPRSSAEDGYRHALERLDQAAITLTQTRLDTAHARIHREQRPQLQEFDLIRGLTGLGVYHLRRHPDHPVTAQVLQYLVRLTEPGDAPDRWPSWWTLDAPNGERDPEFPDGHGNLGASHGISAPLALLSLATLSGVSVSGTREAIERLCAWTDKWLQHDDSGPWWPGLLTSDQIRAGEVDSSLRPRPSWCYGVGGTARAQQLAALALGDTRRQQTAEAAMTTTLSDPVQVGRLTDLGLCHGQAGLLHTAHRMAADACTPHLGERLPNLTNRLLARLPDPAATCATTPTLLDGAAGIALALHAVGNSAVPATGWDAVLAVA